MNNRSATPNIRICTAVATNVKTTPGRVYWAAASVGTARQIDIHNDTDGSTDPVFSVINQPANSVRFYKFDPPIVCSNAIRVEISGTGAKVNLAYE